MSQKLKFKKASADAVHSKRKNMTKSAAGGEAIVKGATSPRSWDGDARSAKFIMTTEQPDRYRDIVGQAGMDLTNFEANPQGLLFHNSRSWPVGSWQDVTKILTGRPRRTEGTLKFLPEGADEDADRAARHVAAGSIKTVSIGFIPDWENVDYILDEDEEWTGGFRFNASELIECSLVPVPANPGALMKDAGGDNVLARNLIEDILDTYTKTPEGLLIPIKDYEDKHFELAGNRTSIVVDKSLKSVQKFASSEDLVIKADNEEEARALNGSMVTVNPTFAENQKDAIFALLAEKRSVGEVISSWIAPEHGEEKDVHVLAVEFLTDDFSGMVRGFKAERFLLAKASGVDASDKPAEGADKDAAAVVDDAPPIDEEKAAEAARLKALATKIADGAIKDAKIADAAVTAERVYPAVISASVGLDTSEATKALDDFSEKMKTTETMFDGMMDKLKKFFGSSTAEKQPVIEKDRIEPVMATPVPLTEEEIASARKDAEATLARIMANA